MAAFDRKDFDAHEAVHQFYDSATGLRVIIAIHSTVLGPAAGGCRRWHYVNSDAALQDALRLSRGMTYKNALAGLPFGGGKAVMLAGTSQQESPELFKAFGRCVKSLRGNYITAEDVGVTTEDMRIVRSVTRYVSGLPKRTDAAGGDPSPWTALGVYLSIKCAVKYKLQLDGLAGLRIAVQGVGNVGYQLCKRLHAAGAHLTIADSNPAHIERVLQLVPATVVDPREILAQDVDVLAPCALGAVLNSNTISGIKAQVIAGAANNQLATDQDGYDLRDRGVLYVPDYICNAGGIISVAREYLGHSSTSQVAAEVRQIYSRVSKLLSLADRTGQPTHRLADEIARSTIRDSMSRKACTMISASDSTRSPG